MVDGFKTLLEGKAPFVQHTALTDSLFPMNNVVKIALVGDWEADNDAATRAAAQIKACNPDIVIHLGDIDDAGQDDERSRSFVDMADRRKSVMGVIPPDSASR